MDFLQEIEITKKIAETKHPNVVKLVGCVLTSEPLSLISEYIPYGCLRKYLLDIRSMVRATANRAAHASQHSHMLLSLAIPW